MTEVEAKVARLEAQQARPSREYMLTADEAAKGRVQVIDEQIAALRAQRVP